MELVSTDMLLVMHVSLLIFTLCFVNVHCQRLDEQTAPGLINEKASGFHPTPPPARHPIPSLYHKRYSEQTFIGTHNAAAIRTKDNNWSLSGNQYFNVSSQLNAGVRLLQAQGHQDPNGSDSIRLCHFNCALMDGGSLDSHLATIKTFLTNNPHEVLTLLFVNTGLPLSHWSKAFSKSGLDVLSYIPPTHKRNGRMLTSDWPTLATLTASNSRLITFLSTGANETLVPYLLPEFDYLFETTFAIENPSQYACAPARPSYPEGTIPDRLSLVNHFLYAKFLGFRFPNASYAGTTNAAGFRVGELGEHAVRCRGLYGRRPNFLMVDFFSEGEVFAVEEGMNAF